MPPFLLFWAYANAKMILMASPPNNWKRPPGRPCITWLNTVQRDLRAYNLTEWSSQPGPEPYSVEADVYAWCYALLVVHARKEEEDFGGSQLHLSMILCCWFGNKGSPVCKEDLTHTALKVAIWSNWCHCYSIISCSIKIQNSLAILVPACPGRSGKEAVKRVSCLPVLRINWTASLF